MTLQECVDDLVMRGCDDWEDACGVASVAIQVGHAQTMDEIRDLSLKIISEVVQQGLMEIGDLPRGEEGDRARRLKLWPGTPEEWLARVEHEWRALGRNPTLWEICWLQNTDKGNALGESLFKTKDAAR